MIKPTLGRIILYKDEGMAEMPAIIVHVWNDHEVNLSVFNMYGTPQGIQSVPLRHPDDEEIPSFPFCYFSTHQIQRGNLTDCTKSAVELEVELVSMLAASAHEANRLYCLSLGDDSQPLWALAPEWQQTSAREGVRYVMRNPETTAADMHNHWRKIKEGEGWVFGETKDPENKTHPCLVDFDKLPLSQQYKDQLFLHTVHTGLAGFYV